MHGLRTLCAVCKNQAGHLLQNSVHFPIRNTTIDHRRSDVGVPHGPLLDLEFGPERAHPAAIGVTERMGSDPADLDPFRRRF